MSVTEKLMAPGTFNVSLNIDLVPNSVVNAIEPWEHIVIMPARVSEDELDDASMLSSAEYVGIITELAIEDETVEVEGTVTYVPTRTNIMVNLTPTYTPHKLRRRFDLDAITNGIAYKDGFI